MPIDSRALLVHLVIFSAVWRYSMQGVAESSVRDQAKGCGRHTFDSQATRAISFFSRTHVSVMP